MRLTHHHRHRYSKVLRCLVGIYLLIFLWCCDGFTSTYHPSCRQTQERTMSLACRRSSRRKTTTREKVEEEEKEAAIAEITTSASMISSCKNEKNQEEISTNNDDDNDIEVVIKVEEPKEPSPKKLLQDWIHHDCTSFHYFTPTEASDIREALLTWYQENRRKLPWRGDSPPYDGSTAGFATKKNKKTTTTMMPTKPNQTETTIQSSITNFFSTTTATNTTTTIKKNKLVSSSSSSSSTATSAARGTKRRASLLDEKDKDNVEIKEEKSTHLLSQQQEQKIQNEAIPVSAYGVWVSEIMLQQTRVEAVIPYWIKWMESFPTVHDLAAASEEQVNAHWAGLGFYRRARLLHKGAQHVVESLDGQLPQTVDELKQISGIGPYTACAIASIAFNVCVPVVDGNVCRVLSRLRGIANHIKSPALKDKLGWDLARQLVQAGDGTQAGLVNQALMELGATYCAPSGTGVDPMDPLRPYYWSTQLGREYAVSKISDEKGSSAREKKIATNGNSAGMTQGKKPGKQQLKNKKTKSATEFCELCGPTGVETVLGDLEEALSISTPSTTLEDSDMAAAQCGHAVFPMDPPKLKKREEDLAVAVLCKDDCWLLVKRPAQGLLAGQWEFPSVCIQTRNETKGAAANATKPPTAQRRRQALTGLLKELFSCDDHSLEEHDVGGHPDYYTSREALVESPIEHIFSHVKHIMWIESCCITDHERKPAITMEWNTENDKQVRWMSEEDMKEVGITSGVKKIIKAVQNEQQSRKKKAKTSSTKKQKKL